MSSGRKTIWLVDASTYQRTLPTELRAAKEQFFRLESCARARRFGPLPLRGERSFSSGLLQLAGLLRANSDVRYMTLDELASSSLIGEIPPDVVGFGAVTPTVPACAAIASRLRLIYPKARLILGGPHAAAAPEITQARFPQFDVVVAARGEKAAAVLGSVARGAIAAPEYDLLPHPLAEYGFNLMTREGCPFSCNYCHDRTIAGREFDLDGGLRLVAPELPAGTPVHFCDSIFGGTAARALAVSSQLARIDHRMSLSCDLRCEMVSAGLMRALTEAGFVEIRIGLESADPAVLRSARRSALPDAVVRSLELVRKVSSLYVSVYFVTGLPGSSLAAGTANREAITQLLRERLADQIKHHIYVPYPRDTHPRHHPDVRPITEDWSAFDRNSFPVFGLSSMTPDQIWLDFLETEATINKEWARVLGLKEADMPSYPLYNDYNVRVYLAESGVSIPQ
jgi:radical SAM superfamily enzyme YgiQ (UPF0313 family)